MVHKASSSSGPALGDLCHGSLLSLSLPGTTVDHITECKGTTLEVAGRTNGSRRAQASLNYFVYCFCYRSHLQVGPQSLTDPNFNMADVAT